MCTLRNRQRVRVCVASIGFACLVLVQTVRSSAGTDLLFSFPRVTRGAYLQSASSEGVVIRWRTAQATTSMVRYGLDPEHLNQSASSAGRFNDHAVRLSSLMPATRYFYAVGTAK